MSVLTKEALDRVPFPFLVYSLISGLVLMYLSPLRIFLPPQIQHPFSVDSPEILGVFLVVAICSISLGTPMYLFLPLIIGNGGLNEWLTSVFKQERRQPRAHQQNSSYELRREETTEFVKWLRATRTLISWDFFWTQNMVVCAFICSGEFAFFADVGFLILSIARTGYMLLAIVSTAISLSLFVFFVVFDKKHFQEHLHRFQREVIFDFHTSSRMTIDILERAHVNLASRLSTGDISEDTYKEASRRIEDGIRKLQDRKSKR